MAIQVISVSNTEKYPDGAAQGILSDIKEFLKIDHVEDLKIVKKYYLEGISKEEAEKMAALVLSEELWQTATLNQEIHDDADYIKEVAYLPGMMNPEVQSVIEAAADMGIKVEAADTSFKYCFYGSDLHENQVNEITQKLLMNSTVQNFRNKTPETLIIKGTPKKIETIPVRNMSNEELMELSEEKLFLNLEEMKIMQEYFKKLDRDPTDGEIEMIAQTWSEHCVHKTFKAKLIIDGKEKEPMFKRLMDSTKEINHELVLSAFKDNSGVIDFGDGYAVCGKVETHNSPSAIEPYGGAATGSGGVFRDIVGTGKGAKVVASTDIFCVAPPDTSKETIPKGCLHPRYILKRVVQGVRDYGNRMGIPTNNGSVHFHHDYRAKPSIIVGSYGLMKKIDVEKVDPHPGDLIVSVGGKTGRDGIHGATFSSGAMSEKTQDIHSSAVQIGNAIEERRAFDAILEMVDQGLIRTITDCGAGGFSSAIGEMGENVGAKVQLDEAPLKYSGLAPWEIWVSESQERMVLAIPQENIDEAKIICKNFNVEGKIIGMFTGDKKLHVTYKDEDLINLDMEFLHDGLPQRTMQGTWTPQNDPEPEIEQPKKIGGKLMEIMEHLNIASKEPIYRQYDHNVQGTSVVAPYTGKNFKTPCDGAVIEPVLGLGRGLAISHGLNPVLNKIDPYYGSLWAIFEAVSNLIAVGANPEKIALIDNFIWPFPDQPNLGRLDRSIDACVDAARALQMPFISGKDSLSSTYKAKDGSTIEIPPTLCISAFGHVDNIENVCTSNFKKAGNLIVAIGRATDEMAGSVYYDIQGELGSNLPKPNIDECRANIFSTAHAIQQGVIEACHDISEGGIAAAITEMCWGEELGARFELAKVPNSSQSEPIRPDFIAFNESPARFVVEVKEENLPKLKEIFEDVHYSVIGEVTDNQELRAEYQGGTVIDKGIYELKESWEKPMLKVFGSF